MTENPYREIVCYGGAGHALVMLNAAESYWKGSVRVVAVVDDYAPGGTHPVLGVPIITAEERAASFTHTPVFLGIGDGSACARIGARLRKEGASLVRFAGAPDLTHATAQIGEGSLVGDYTRIGPNVQIRDYVQVLSDLIAHDVTVENGCHLGVHSSILGHVTIGAEAHIGPHAVIANGTPKERLIIGEGARIGVGAVVSRSVPAGAHVIGNPAMSVAEWKVLKDMARERAAQS